LAVVRGKFTSFAKFKNSEAIASGLMDNFCIVVVTVNGIKTLSVMALLREKSDVAARRSMNGLNKLTTTPSGSYRKYSISSHHGYYLH